MKDDDALREILRDLSISLSEDGNIRDIEFRHDEELGAINQDRQITINPDHAKILGAENEISELQEFALIVNTESHEIEHDQVTDVEAMEEFSKEYKESRPRLAGFIWNVIEDVYIDKRRTDRDRGLRPTLALQSELIRKNAESVTEMEAPYKHANAVLQIGKAGGTPVGFDDVEDEEFKDYCAEIRDLVDKARSTPIQSERTEIAHQIMELMKEYAGNMDTPDLDMPSFIMGIPEDKMDEEGDPLPEPQENDQEVEGDEQPTQGGQQSGQKTTQGDGEGSYGENSTTPNCPKCGFENPNTGTQTVDGMISARCHPPFSRDANWITSVEFVADNDENGVCGFRVNTKGQIPKDHIQNQGYKVVETGGGTVEILEPKNNYDDEEDIVEYSCPDCGHNWVPSIGEL